VVVILSLLFACVGYAQKGKPVKPEAKKEPIAQFTASQLLKRMSYSDIKTALGKTTIVDSGFVPDGKQSLKMYAYSPVMFDGFAGRLQVVLDHDTTKTVTVQVPRLRKATSEDFSKLSKAIVDEIGEPSVTVNNYINYLRGQEQPVFGVLKDGLITITIKPTDKLWVANKL
jgi:hypothetical protein